MATWPIWILNSPVYQDLQRWIFCLALALAIPWFREIRWAALTTPAKHIAKYSYGIYLAHGTLIVLAFGILQHWPAWMQWPVLLIGICVVPVLVFRLIEQPMISLGVQLESRISGSDKILAEGFAKRPAQAEAASDRRAGRAAGA